MSSFMTSLSKSSNNDFVTKPSDLLVTHRAMVLDVRSMTGSVTGAASSLLKDPDRGVYVRNSTDMLFSVYEPLFTHRQKFDFFPEIASPVFVTGVGVVRQSVGEQISWRAAVEQPINVYNAEGRLLLDRNHNRNQLAYLPGPELYAAKFCADLIEIAVLNQTEWGDTNKAIKSLKDYLTPEVDLESIMEFAYSLTGEYLDIIREFVNVEPWAIYKLSQLGTNVLVESSCDWRHYKCNEKLYEQQEQQYIESTWTKIYDFDVKKSPTIDVEDLDWFFTTLFEWTGQKVTTVPEFFALLEAQRGNKHFNKMLTNLFDFYLSKFKTGQTGTSK